MIILAELYFVMSQSTRLTDGRTEFSWLDRVCIKRSAVKTLQLYCSHGVFCILVAVARST